MFFPQLETWIEKQHKILAFQDWFAKKNYHHSRLVHPLENFTIRDQKLRSDFVHLGSLK